MLLCCEEVEAVDLLNCCVLLESYDLHVLVFDVSADEVEDFVCWFLLEFDLKQLKQLMAWLTVCRERILLSVKFERKENDNEFYMCVERQRKEIGRRSRKVLQHETRS